MTVTELAKMTREFRKPLALPGVAGVAVLSTETLKVLKGELPW